MKISNHTEGSPYNEKIRESMKNDAHVEKRKFVLYEHPWLSLFAVILTSVISMVISSNLIFRIIGLSGDSFIGRFSQPMTFHILTSFIFTPLVLCLPKGKSTYKQYLSDIGLSKTQPFIKLILLALSCSLLLLLSQSVSSFVYRLFEGQPLTINFIRSVFDLSEDLPPNSLNILTTLPSIFEEIAFRGIALTVFLNKYSERKSIIFSSMGFGLMHLLNLAFGRELIWVIGQIIWAFTSGLFYGYVFVRTRSLLPSMIVHYLGNVFVGSLAGYMQNNASLVVSAIYGVIFSYGIVPTTLMILWAKFFISTYNPINPEKIQWGDRYEF